MDLQDYFRIGLDKFKRKPHSLLTALMLMATVSYAQYVPPDRFGDEHQGADVLRKNNGQVFGTDGQPRRDAYSFLDYCQFEYGLDGMYTTPATNPEPAQQPHDGFIASFDLQFQTPVGITEPSTRSHALGVTLLPLNGTWSVHFPENDDWTVTAYNAAGQQVGVWHATSSSLVLDLTAQPQGMYLLVATTAARARYSAKVVRP